MVDSNFWKNKNVFITGHTGFKGSWLCMWLVHMGARVTGYALQPSTVPNLFELSGLENEVQSITGDIRHLENLCSAIDTADPDIIIHMAAQPLVRESYLNPVETYHVNVLGTVHLLEAVRLISRKRNRPLAVICVTTDKCYENQEWYWGYRENDRLGGYDPYSNSKACCELAISAYRNSFFADLNYAAHGVSLASVRAGNVIGGGDWSTDRLIPDCFRAIFSGEAIAIRNPKSVRPWQHVLEPLSGYLILGQKLYESGIAYSEEWNFGPNDDGLLDVEGIVSLLCMKWGEQARYEIQCGDHPHEANLLQLDCSKAKKRLGWVPKWDAGKALDLIVDWMRSFRQGSNMAEVCINQIELYQKS